MLLVLLLLYFWILRESPWNQINCNCVIQLEPKWIFWSICASWLSLRLNRALCTNNVDDGGGDNTLSKSNLLNRNSYSFVCFVQALIVAYLIICFFVVGFVFVISVLARWWLVATDNEIRVATSAVNMETNNQHDGMVIVLPATTFLLFNRCCDCFFLSLSFPCLLFSSAGRSFVDSGRLACTIHLIPQTTISTTKIIAEFCFTRAHTHTCGIALHLYDLHLTTVSLWTAQMKIKYKIGLLACWILFESKNTANYTIGAHKNNTTIEWPC